MKLIRHKKGEIKSNLLLFYYMKKLIISFCGFISLLVIVTCLVILLYSNGIKAVSKSNKEIEFEVTKGSNYYSIASSLKNKGLIKSELWYKVYLKLNNTPIIKQGVHKLNKNMSVKEIIEQLSKNAYDPNALNLTFKEGYNFYDIIDVITSNTNNTEEDIINLLNNEEFIDKIINDYWFITDEIKNDKLYYKLEGYLYPDTYQFKDKDVSVEEIFNELLKQMDKKLSKYKEKIEKSEYSVHQILTLASIIELEGVTEEDRGNIAGVFYNRLNNNMNLGSDVTTYYGARVRLSEKDIKEHLNDENGYNTRLSTMVGKLPIGPICNPSLESIDAALNPINNDYYYFVSDKNKKTYFTKTSKEHNAKINELKKDGLWFEYE